ncbi:hypothetical protein SAMD00019534_091990 [Acytostelium subglobosum LB1]|uniref:hypothetical protein n=1 Tax=Acytostelium subglobosum LB1 TaxID=1410327 RepID=UPI000644FD2C|nr:hypothetical protein SAMD00019534_091990 [Acytostelium subglobosum LB1]GAM26024.1 hypothetical protein SAMD00019534_091990 [Acytostelium subglobosum LB1]|eukprot:XP_012751067.1 hypothetical protein SAMD00019534_091990 [Acytostelium subglobosum LB1]
MTSRIQQISQQARKVAVTNHSLVTKEVLRSNDLKLIHQSLSKLNDWINNPKSDMKDLEKTGIFPAMFELLNHEDIELVRSVILSLKLVSLKDTPVNEILRSLDAVHLLETLLETSYDPDILNDSATTIECLRRCAPYSTRRVGLGQYDESSGAFQWTLELRQLHFDDVGVAWRVWDAGIGFCRWILENPDIFTGKDVLELGSGLGIAGLAAGLLAKSVLMTDYTPKIVRTLRDNVKINSIKVPAIRSSCEVAPLDWKRDKVPKVHGFEVIIGTEVVYDVNLVEALARVIHKSLTRKGTFYGTCATVRQGIPEFIKCMEDKYGFEVNVSEFPKRFVPDTKFDTLFLVCKRKRDIPVVTTEEDTHDEDNEDNVGDHSTEESVDTESTADTTTTTTTTTTI